MIDKSISIIVPVYNGRKYLDELVTGVFSSTTEFKSCEIILVDDSSPDNSYEQINELAKKDDRILGIKLDGNFGQQNAILCGLANARGDYAVIMDDDLENPPEAIPQMYKEIARGYDVVYALDKKRSYKTGFRKMGSLLRDITFRLLSHLPKGTKVCSYRIMTSDLYKKVADANTSFVYISMEILKYTTNISNIEVDYGRRKESGHSSYKLIKLLMNIYIYYSLNFMKKLFAKPGLPYEIEKSTREKSA